MAAGVLVMDWDGTLAPELGPILTRRQIMWEAAPDPDVALACLNTTHHQVLVTTWHAGNDRGQEILSRLVRIPDRPIVILVATGEARIPAETSDVVSLVLKHPYDPAALAEMIAHCLSSVVTNPSRHLSERLTP
jgi:DNA-binding NtrC family response regulator